MKDKERKKERKKKKKRKERKSKGRKKEGKKERKEERKKEAVPLAVNNVTNYIRYHTTPHNTLQLHTVHILYYPLSTPPFYYHRHITQILTNKRTAQSTNESTPRSTDFLHKTVAPQLVKKFPAFCGT